MLGLGDSIYQRAFIRHLSDAYVVTTWPELYQDVGVKCIKAQTRLRTQGKSAEKTTYAWHTAPAQRRDITVRYNASDLRVGSILTAMSRQFGVMRPTFDLPDFGPSPIQVDRPVALVRPVTARREWLNAARNPLPEYVFGAASELRRRGFYVVSVADIQDGEEWLVGEPPEVDLALHNGELSITELLSAVQHASVVVGGVGWVVPACISANTPLYCILGGQLGHNAPEKITGSGMALSRAGWAWPEIPCFCTSKGHDCNKVINGFEQKFSAWLDRQGLFAGAGKQPDLAA